MPDTAIEFIDGALKNRTVAAGKADHRIFAALIKPGLANKGDVEALSAAIGDAEALAIEVQSLRDQWADAEKRFADKVNEIEGLQAELRDKLDPPAPGIDEAAPAVTVS